LLIFQRQDSFLFKKYNLQRERKRERSRKTKRKGTKRPDYPEYKDKKRAEKMSKRYTHLSEDEK
jgi:hypothetical protein